MKGLIKYGLAAAMVFATAMPAMARSWVVCVDTTKDARFSTEATAGNNLFFVRRRRFIRGGTVCDCDRLHAEDPQGRRLALSLLSVAWIQVCRIDDTGCGGSVFVLWHFRITGRGAFDTTGPSAVENLPADYHRVDQSGSRANSRQGDRSPP